MGLLDKIEPNSHRDDSAERLATAQKAVQEAQLAKSRASRLLLDLHQAFLLSGAPPESLGRTGLMRPTVQGWSLVGLHAAFDGHSFLAVGVDGHFYKEDRLGEKQRCRRIELKEAVETLDSYGSSIRLVNGRPAICYSGRECYDLEQALAAAVNDPTGRKKTGRVYPSDT